MSDDRGMLPGFGGALAARLSGFRTEIERALAGWQQERRRRWEELRGRIESLTIRLTVAERGLRHKLTALEPQKERVPEILRRVIGFERERRLVEEEIWALLGAVAREDRAWRRQVGDRAGELQGLARRVGNEIEGALAGAVAGETVRMADTAAGRAAADEVRRSLAGLRRRLEEVGHRVDQGLARAGARDLPDVARLLGRLDALLAERLGGEPAAGPSPAARAPRRARPAARTRKQAKVPRFLINKFYRTGNLRRFEDRVEITFTNPLAFCIVQGFDPALVDGKEFPKERTIIDNGERRLVGDQLSDRSYLKFPKGAAITVTLDGLAIRPGPHQIMCALEMRKMGWVDLEVKDSVS